MTQKELVILAAQLDLAAGRWSVASIDAGGCVDPLVQSAVNDLAKHTIGSDDEKTSFLRHRIAGAIQRGADRLWGLTRKAELFAIQFIPVSATQDSDLIARVADHFCTWMVKPPVVCLQTDDDGSVSLLASNTEEHDLQRITVGLTAMRPLTSQEHLWETVAQAAES